MNKSFFLFILIPFLFLKAQEENILTNKFIGLSDESKPALFYTCFKKSPLSDPSLSYWDMNLSVVADSIDVFASDQSAVGPFYLGSIPCTAFINLDESAGVEDGFFANNDSIYKYDKFISDSQYLTLRNSVGIIKEKKSSSSQLIEGKKIKSQVENISNDKNFDSEIGITQSVIKISSYLAMFAGILLFFSALKNFNVLNSSSFDKNKVLIAKRKKWLNRIWKSGRIEEKLYLKLLDTITTENWISEKDLSKINQSITEGISVTTGDFNNRKRGESVVKMSDMSEVRTSR